MSRGKGTTSGASVNGKGSFSDWRVWVGFTFLFTILAGIFVATGLNNVLQETRRGTNAALSGSVDAKQASELARKAADEAKSASEQAAALSALASQFTDPNSVYAQEAAKQRQELLDRVTNVINKQEVLQAQLTALGGENAQLREQIAALLAEIVDLRAKLTEELNRPVGPNLSPSTTTTTLPPPSGLCGVLGGLGQVLGCK